MKRHYVGDQRQATAGSNEFEVNAENMPLFLVEAYCVNTDKHFLPVYLYVESESGNWIRVAGGFTGLPAGFKWLGRVPQRKRVKLEIGVCDAADNVWFMVVYER